MRQAWVICVLAIGCSKKSEPPKAGSGSPVAVAADAQASALPADAAVAGPDAAVDDKLAAIPEGGILLATIAKENLVVAKLDRQGVKIQHQMPVSEMASFAWLDASTLALKEPYGKQDKPVVMKIVDGKPAESVELEEAWQQSAMLVTKTGEVWLERCTEQPEGPDPCTKLAYLRVWPSKKAAPRKPKDLDDERVSGTLWARGFQGRAPTAPAPAGIKVEIKKNVPKGEGNALISAWCSKPGASAVYPTTKGDEALYGYTAKATRWVLTEPPIYELVADQTNPVGQVEQQVEYLKACEGQPLGGFIGLGGPLWGEYKDADVVAGTWTFRVGTQDLGTLDGGALRANR